jgi:hypothetical protein
LGMLYWVYIRSGTMHMYSKGSKSIHEASLIG